MDPLEVVRAVGPAIFRAHHKVTFIDAANTLRSGVIDLGGGGRLRDRSRLFCALGCGHDAQRHMAQVSALRLVGHDRAASKQKTAWCHGAQASCVRRALCKTPR